MGISVAGSALQAQQTAMSVVGHNVANANNPNFHRQEAVFGARSAWPYLGANGSRVGQLGQGIDVTTVRRYQDQFVQNRLTDSRSALGQWQTGKGMLDRVVGVLNEPSDQALNNDLNQFWNAWQQLSLSPQNVPARNNLLEYAGNLAGSFNRLSTQMETMGRQGEQDLSGRVETINTLASRIAEVNGQIQQTLSSGAAPNDLLDTRDALLSNLAQLTDVTVRGSGGAEDIVSIGGHALVQGIHAEAVEVGKNASGQTAIIWKGDGSEATISGGEVGGLLDLTRNVLPSYRAGLDQVAGALISTVNGLHQSGYGMDHSTGRAFFTGSAAADIAVNPQLKGNPAAVAASSNGSAGDAGIALAIANAKTQSALNGATLGQAYASLVARIGSDAASATNRLETQTQVHQQLTTQQQSVSGVSLDEEMTKMIQFQQSYAASARVMNVMDEMIGTLVDRLGVGGR